MGYYPSIKELQVRPGKRVLMRVRRSLRSIMSHIVLVTLSSAIIYILVNVFPEGRVPDVIPVLRNISFWWLGAFPIFVLIEMLRKYHDDLYIFGPHRLTHLSGRLSLTYSIPSVRYIDIRAITVTQDLVGRVLGYGKIEIGTSAQEGNEMVIEGVRDPWVLAVLIDKLRTHSQLNVKRMLRRAEKGKATADDVIETVRDQLQAEAKYIISPAVASLKLKEFDDTRHGR